MGKTLELHPLHFFVAGFFLLAGPVAAQECCEEKTQEEKEECVNCLAIVQFKHDVGDFRWVTKLDMTFGRSPRPMFIEFTGKGENQMILDEQFLLSRSIQSNDKDKESVSVTGFRTDSNNYFMLTLDFNRTPFGWYEGITEWDGSRVLKDPSDHVLIRTVWEKSGISTTTYSLGDALFLETTAKSGRRANRSKVNPLKTLLGGSIKPKKINLKADKKDPAENFSEEHLLLQRLAGDFDLDSEDGTREEVTSRLICQGRFLISASMETHEDGEVSESLAFLGFDSSKKVFQMFRFNPGVSYPRYWTGVWYEDVGTLNGTLSLEDPLAPGASIEIRFKGDGGYSWVQTSDLDVEDKTEKAFDPLKKKRR
jgi:hypothetical protein